MLTLLAGALIAGPSVGLVGAGAGNDTAVSWASPDRAIFQGRTIVIPQGVLVATDGDSYFYATRDHKVASETASDACARAVAAERIPTPSVLISTAACSWVLHPNIACSATDICSAAVGVLKQLPPVPQVVEQGRARTGESESAETPVPTGASFFGVGKWQSLGVRSYGVRNWIQMADTQDTFESGTSCHHRWPGQTWPADGAHPPFIQVGTATCYFYPDQYYKKWCYYFDRNGDAHSVWSSSYFGPTTLHEEFSFYSPYGDSYFECRWGGLHVWTHAVDALTPWAEGPWLMGVGEINFGGDNSWAREHFAPNVYATAVQYFDGWDWLNPPAMDFYYSPDVTTTCSDYGWGVALAPAPAIKTGSSQGCPTGTAW